MADVEEGGPAQLTEIALSPVQQIKVHVTFANQKKGSSPSVGSEQGMDVPGMLPITPLDEAEVRQAHSQLRRKVHNHVVPWLFVLVLLIAMCGRNQGIAALSMQPRLGFTDAEYGFGSSIFYAGVIVAQLPAVWIARRIGVPALLSITLALWGIGAGLFALLPYVSEPFLCFCALRVLLGAAEGALIPGMYYYLTIWYGSLPDNLASMHGQVTIASQVASVIGGVLAAKLLLLDGTWGLEGWQWLFLIEAAPVLLAALVTPCVLARGPEDANWLDMNQRQMLAELKVSTGPNGYRRTVIAAADSSAVAYNDEWQSKAARSRQQQERADEQTSGSMTATRMTALALTDWRVAYLSVCVLLLQVTLWSLVYWQPTLIKMYSDNTSDYHVALVNALPHLCGVLGTLVLGYHASHSSCGRQAQRSAEADVISSTERRWHSSAAMIVGGLALVLATSTLGVNSSIAMPLVMLCLANGCLWAVGGLLATWPNVWLDKQAAVVALAVQGMASATGGLVGPWVIGLLTQALDKHNDDLSGRGAEHANPEEWASGVGFGSGEGMGMWEADGSHGTSEDTMTSLHAAVRLLGGCAIAAGLMAACFQPRRPVGEPANAVQQQWHPEVDVIAA